MSELQSEGDIVTHDDVLCIGAMPLSSLYSSYNSYHCHFHHFSAPHHQVLNERRSFRIVVGWIDAELSFQKYNSRFWNIKLTPKFFYILWLGIGLYLEKVDSLK